MNGDTWEAVARLALAAGLSGLIGFEREVAQKAAGVRTHMLVGLGAGLFALVGAESISGADPARIAAQVVPGVGFLGAGAIFRHGFSVRGLTTAAGMWTAAAVGVAAGIGELVLATVGTATALVVLYVFGILQWLGRGRKAAATDLVDVKVHDPALLAAVCDTACRLVGRRTGVRVHSVGMSSARVRVLVEPEMTDSVMVDLAEVEGVERVQRFEP